MAARNEQLLPASAQMPSPGVESAVQGSQAYDMVSNIYLGAEGPLKTDVLLPASASGNNTTASDSGSGGGGSLDILFPAGVVVYAGSMEKAPLVTLLTG